MEIYANDDNSTVEKAFRPEYTAFVTIDVQNVFCHVARGPLWWTVRDQREINRTVYNLQNAVSSARESGMPIIHMRSPVRPSSEFDFYRLRPEAPDICLNKQECSAFEDDMQGRMASGSPLDDALSHHRIATLILSGYWLEICVKQTAESALKRGFNVAVLQDCSSPFDYSKKSHTLEEMKEKGVYVMNAPQFKFTHHQCDALALSGTN